MKNPQFSDDTVSCMPCCILIDTSELTKEQDIAYLNMQLSELRELNNENRIVHYKIDVSVITYGGKVREIYSFAPPEHFTAPQLTAQGKSFLGSAVCKALDNIEDRKVFYETNGINCLKPLLIIYAAGHSEGESDKVLREAEKRLKITQTEKSLTAIVIAMGNEVDLPSLTNITGIFTIKPNDFDLSDLLRLYYQSSEGKLQFQDDDETALLEPDQEYDLIGLEEADEDNIQHTLPDWKNIETSLKEESGDGGILRKKDVAGFGKIRRIFKSPVKVDMPKFNEEVDLIRDTSILTNLGAAEELIQFKAYYPKEVKPEVWYSVLAYAYIEMVEELVRKDSETYLGTKSKQYRKGEAKTTQSITRGTEITVVPELPGCQFNPSRSSILWLEDMHRLEFRMRATNNAPGFSLNTSGNGRISFYVGSILIAEIKMSVYCSDEVDTDPDYPDTDSTAEQYKSVFVSYAHNDTSIVRELEKAYVALGMKYLRDVNILRSGEKWNPALLKKIEEADIFQLCWSTAAKKSTYVKQEWQHALKLQRQSFLRPVYWETPMPDPPDELRSIHFACLQ